MSKLALSQEIADEMAYGNPWLVIIELYHLSSMIRMTQVAGAGKKGG